MPTPDPRFWPDLLLLLPVAAVILICVVFIDRPGQPRPENGDGLWRGCAAPLIAAFLILVAAWFTCGQAWR